MQFSFSTFETNELGLRIPHFSKLLAKAYVKHEGQSITTNS